MATDLVCPKCQGLMRTYERSGVTVDQCADCRGIFWTGASLSAWSTPSRAGRATLGPAATATPAASASGSAGPKTPMPFGDRYDDDDDDHRRYSQGSQSAARRASSTGSLTSRPARPRGSPWKSRARPRALP